MMRDLLLRLMVTAPMLAMLDALAQEKGKGKGKALDVTDTPLPEPGSLEPIAIGAVSVLVAVWLKKRKK
jgi:hypothetical protein